MAKKTKAQQVNIPAFTAKESELSGFNRVYIARVKEAADKFRASELAAIQKRRATVKIVN